MGTLGSTATALAVVFCTYWTVALPGEGMVVLLVEFGVIIQMNCTSDSTTKATSFTPTKPQNTSFRYRKI